MKSKLDCIWDFKELPVVFEQSTGSIEGLDELKRHIEDICNINEQLELFIYCSDDEFWSFIGTNYTPVCKFLDSVFKQAHLIVSFCRDCQFKREDSYELETLNTLLQNFMLFFIRICDKSENISYKADSASAYQVDVFYNSLIDTGILSVPNLLDFVELFYEGNEDIVSVFVNKLLNSCERLKREYIQSLNVWTDYIKDNGIEQSKVMPSMLKIYPFVVFLRKEGFDSLSFLKKVIEIYNENPSEVLLDMIDMVWRQYFDFVLGIPTEGSNFIDFGAIEERITKDCLENHYIELLDCIKPFHLFLNHFNTRRGLEHQLRTLCKDEKYKENEKLKDLLQFYQGEDDLFTVSTDKLDVKYLRGKTESSSIINDKTFVNKFKEDIIRAANTEESLITCFEDIGIETNEAIETNKDILLGFYEKHRKCFDPSEKHSKETKELIRTTNMSYEQIRGWFLMFDKNPDKLKLLGTRQTTTYPEDNRNHENPVIQFQQEVSHKQSFNRKHRKQKSIQKFIRNSGLSRN